MVRALALALLALALLPAAALAHATLQATVPERGAKLDTPPAQVVFRFDEAVEASFGALRVFNSEGQEVQTGKAFHPGGKGAEIAVKLRPGLGDGTYTATYRVVSADGHAVSSGFVFTVGEASAPSESLDQLLAGGGTGSVTNTALAVARGVQYAAIALGLGALIFLLVCWAPLGIVSPAFSARLERVILFAAVAGLLSAAAAVVLQGAVGQGGTFWEAAKPSVVSEVLGTRFGRAWGLGALAWAAVLAALATRPLRPRGTTPVAAPAPEPVLVGAGPPTTAVAPAATAPAARVGGPRLVALAIPLFALVLLPSFGGHTSVQEPVAVLLPANLLHVLAMSAWLGGIAVLVLALRTATSELAPEDRTPLLASVVSRFSALATIALPVLLLSGVVQAIVEVGSFPALLDSAFGRAVSLKIAVALGIIGLGYVNRQRLLPALRTATTPGRTGVLLRRTLRFELALGLTAIAITGALSSYAPSVAESSGPFATTVNVGPARLEVTVDPARVGPNQLHLYLFDRKTGAAFEGTKELRATAAMPSKRIAPITLSPHIAGPGHYVVDGAALAVAGDWTISIVDPRLRLRRVRDPFHRPDQVRSPMLKTALVVAAILLLPATAHAHVTLQPNTAAAGAFTRLDVRVPNERDDASTNKVEVQFPEGFSAASYEPVPGWDVEVTKKTLSTPIQTDDGEITEGVDTITWTADSDADAIPPGGFQDFGISVQIPGKAGDELTFKALQTYTGGEVVRWIGAEGSDNPAAVVTVTEATEADHGASHDEDAAEATPSPAVRTSATAATPTDDDDSNALVIVALILGALGLIAALAGLIRPRRSA